MSRVEVVLVAGGRWHDFDYARLQLLIELDLHEAVHTRVFEDYDCLDALAAAAVLITYTCDVRPTPEQQLALTDFVRRGGRWLALHGTNSAIQPQPDGRSRPFSTPRALGPVAEVLGSQFLSHPPIVPYLVSRSTNRIIPVVQGIPAFETSDELYLSELHPPLRVLLSTRFSGPCPSFTEGQLTDDDPRPVLYLKDTGAGTVCYFTLGHCRGRFDVQDLGVPDFGRIDRGSWVSPEFRTILTRAVAWAVSNAWATGTELLRTP